ncbi:MAG: phosphatase PAP2 family protein [Alistipes sp.]|nr:phosphatase PAP2 family protein [Alistipes sp.]
MQQTLSFDERLFLWLNFDGGVAMDSLMEIISGWLVWVPLYLFILYAVWRKFGMRGLFAFIVCLVLAMGLADMLCGIFKHSGMLANVWADFPARHRPMFDAVVRDLAHVPSYKHGPYGTVSAHAATVAAMAVLSALTLRRCWFSWVVGFVVVLVSYSRIYLACHYPKDLALGWMVGIVCGVAMYYLWRAFYKTLERYKR